MLTELSSGGPVGGREGLGWGCGDSRSILASN